MVDGLRSRDGVPDAFSLSVLPSFRLSAPAPQISFNFSPTFLNAASA
jgi:hypothetical protein